MRRAGLLGPPPCKWTLHRHHLPQGHTYCHTQRQRHAMAKSYAILTTPPTQTCHRHTFFQRCFFSCVPCGPPDAHDSASHESSLPSGDGVACFPLSLPTPPTHTLWYCTRCLQLLGSPGRVGSSRNSQPILGPLSPSPPCPHAPHCHRPRHIRHSPTRMRSLTPHSPALTLEEDRWALAFPRIKCGVGGHCHKPPQGIAHRLAWPQPCLLLSL